MYTYIYPYAVGAQQLVPTQMTNVIEEPNTNGDIPNCIALKRREDNLYGRVDENGNLAFTQSTPGWNERFMISSDGSCYLAIPNMVPADASPYMFIRKVIS